jgi:pyruvate kinase
MTTIEITAEQLLRLSRANQALRSAALNGTRSEVDDAANAVVTLVDVLVLPEHLATS